MPNGIFTLNVATGGISNMFIDIQKISGGLPLPGGMVYIGLSTDNPVDTPASVYTDEACTTPITTPVLLNFNGLPVDSTGAQINLYVNFDFSIQLQDKYGANFYLVAPVISVDDEFYAIADTGAVISFESTKIYNSVASPETGNITDDLADAKIGAVQKIYHNHSIAPAFPAGWVKIGTGTYATSTLNIIYCEWVSGTRVEYWIVQ